MSFFIYMLGMVVPGLIALCFAKLIWPTKVTKSEFHIGLGGAFGISVVASCLIYAIMQSSVLDTEIWNGYVTSKASKKVSCEHEYVCGKTCTTSGKVTTCTPIYCDEHSYDVDWRVESTVGSTRIRRVDRQGLKEPARFAEVQVGEFFANENTYANYLKANKESLFYKDKEKAKDYKPFIPDYPRVRDYYKHTKVFDYTSADTSKVQDMLLDWLKLHGGKKQVNIIALFTNEGTQHFDMVESRWGGVKKNDILLMFGMKGNTVEWFRSTSFADGMNNKELHVKLRNSATGEEWSTDLLKVQLDLILKEFTRIPNAEFKDLVENMTPPFSLVMTLFVLALIANFILIAVLVNNDETDDKPKFRIAQRGNYNKYRGF